MVQELEGEGFPRKGELHHKWGANRLLTAGDGPCRGEPGGGVMDTSTDRSG